MDKYIITLIGFDYENKTNNFEVIDDAHIKTFVFEAGEWTRENISRALNQFISDVYDNIVDEDKEDIVAKAFDNCRLPFASLLYQMAMDKEGLIYRISDWHLYGGVRL